MLASAPYSHVPVLNAWDETPQLRAIQIELPPEFAALHTGPGQVVTIRTAEGAGYFALASAPGAAATDLLLKHGGKISDSAIAAAAPGRTLEVSAPFGKGFPLDEARGRDVLLFAAGSGIAPIRSLIQEILAHREEYGRVTLFYGHRRGADFAYRSEHLAWERGGVRVVLCPSREDDAWQGVRGRVQQVARSIAFGGSPPGDSVAFVCGMHAMVDDVRATLGAAGVPPERVHVNF